MKKIDVTMFPKCYDKRIYQTISLWDWLLKDNIYEALINDIRSSKTNGYTRLKRELPAITPGGVFSGRGSDKLVKPSNLICIDIDGKDNLHIDDMEELKQLISKLFPVMYCGLSVSGKGVYCLIKIASHLRHTDHFNALKLDFETANINIDISCKDIGRLRYLSIDKNPYVNEDSEIYEKTISLDIQPQKESSNTFTKMNLPSEVRTNPVVNSDIFSLEDVFLKPIRDDRLVMVTFDNAIQMTLYIEFKKVANRKIDITAIHRNWITICIIIKLYFDYESGKKLFHEVSCFYFKYSHQECEDLFDKIKIRKDRKPSLSKIFALIDSYLKK